jgi:hypothetical protein
MESSWRYLPGEGTAFHRAHVRLEGGGIVCEVGFEAADLAQAARDDGASGELAASAIAQWRSCNLSA